MKKLISLFLIILLFVGIICSQTIKEIKIEGLKNLERDFFLSIINMGEGKAFSSMQLQQDIRNLYELGYFENIKVDIKESASGAIIKYIVKERPFINDIKIKGNKVFDDGEILSEIPFLTRDVPFDKMFLHKIKYQLTKKYQKKGYASVEVITRADKTEEGVDVEISIKEGKKISIGKIVFKGIDSVDPDELKKAMETEESRWWKHPKLDRKKLEEDMTRIKDKLKKLGYFNYQIKNYEVEIDKERQRADIFISLNEGNRYRLKNFSFKGNSLFEENELKKLVELEVGEFYTGEEWEKTKQNLAEKYGDKSYLFASIEPEYNFKGEELDLTININEGNPIKVGDIKIKGNTKTFDSVILRKLLLKPGEKFKRNRLVLSQRRLYNTGYFEDLKILPQPQNNNPNIMDLTVKVKEKSTGSINFGGTYNGVSGFAMFLKYEEKNIMGRGIKGNIQVDYGKKRKTFELGLTDSYFMNTNTYVSVSGYRKLNVYDEYDIFRNGGQLTLGRNLSLFTTGYISYKYERIQLENIIQSAEEDVSSREETRSSASITFERDTRDNKFEPTEGTHNEFTAELGGKFLGGDINYHKYKASTNWFFKSFWKLVLSNKLEIGAAEKLSPSREVPHYERFFVGGSTYGVRGYDDKYLSPKNESGYITGGNFYLINTLTYKAPLVKNRLTGYVFWDVGKAWENIGDFNFREMKDGAGIGVKVRTPMGPVTLEYAYGFDTENWKFHFGIFRGEF
ncbi:MAG: outer membrane protein assembly factor BamA [Candidatus Mcinerneyibacterium aminivorans]|uniref:Outer membrane protein assembly factor BamA n=1 Tax=Candidatus Mcinerneyibacterium aminivorans TaxID=2703815 RepID=A0A5D0MJV8_9BACT|nr:MAG: outer membrane protein assembly factor BamA [Candidatus Mcinerneyibacterium aminivorans]